MAAARSYQGHADDRIQELEAENARMRAQLKDLMKRLQDLGQDPSIAA